MLALSENNLEVDVPGTERGDEIGKMARSVLVLKENSIAMRKLEEEQRKEQEAQAPWHEIVKQYHDALVHRIVQV